MKWNRRVLGAATAALLLTAGLSAPAQADVAPALSWGGASYGQLGDGTGIDRAIPGPVCAVGQSAPCASQLTGATAIAAGYRFSLALLSDGTVASWGDNGAGQLGDGSTTNRATPVRVCAVGQSAPCSAYLTGVSAISAGYYFGSALLNDGSVVSWGFNGLGQVGDGTTTDRSTPVRVCALDQVAPCSAFLTGVSAIAAGQQHTVAEMSDDSLLSWGGNGFGTLGDGTNSNRSVPVRVCAVGQTAPCSAYLSGVNAIAGGGYHTLAALTDGSVVAVGYNGEGELGDGTTTGRSIPVRVCAVGQTAPCGSFLSGVTALVAGHYLHSVALGAGGAVYTWGAGNDGELGDGGTANQSVPVRVCAVGQTAPCGSFLSGVVGIAAGEFGTRAVLSSGAALTWGNNSNGQLGDGTTTNRPVPVRVCAVGQTAPCSAFLSGISALVAGGNFTLALQTPPSADLAVRLSAKSGLLNPTIEYTVKGTNHGPGTVSSGTITLRVPPNTASVSSSTCTYNASAKTVSCPTGPVANGATVTHKVKTTIGLLTVGLPLDATATRTASSPSDPNPGNDAATAHCVAATSLVILC